MTLIKIPKAQEKEVFTLPSGTVGNINERFKKIDQVLFGIVLVVILAMIAIIVSVVGLFLDQLRFNNTMYTEYSHKLDVILEEQKTNHILLEENAKNREININLQKKLDLLMQKINQK